MVTMTNNDQQPNDIDDGIDFGDPALNGTEEDIMGGFDDAQQDSHTDATPAETPPQSNDAEGDGNNDNDVGTSKGGDGKPAQQRQPVQADQGDGKSGVDAQGNRVDAAGNIVASAGRERRIFEQNEKLKRTLGASHAELEQLRAQVDNAQVLNDLPKQYNLQPNDVQAAMQIMGNFKKDPVSVAKWALQETLAMGYNLQQIVGEGEGGIEMQAIARMIDQRVGPVVQQNQQTVKEQQNNQAALREYNTFMQKHEHADVHEEALGKMLQKDNTISPEAAYWRLREFAARNQFDFSQDLGPQIIARQQQAQQPAPPAQQQQPPTPMRAPMPNGVSPNTPAQSAQQPFANPNDDWDDIVGSSMREAGIIQ